MNRHLLLALSSTVIISSSVTYGGMTVYSNKSQFISNTGATATAPLPKSGLVTTLTVGDLTFTTPSPHFAVDEYSNRLVGNVISVTDMEHLNVDTASSIYSFGFDFHEPRFDPGLFAPFFDSTFTVSLFDQGSAVGSFTFNAPNDTAAFVGVSSMSKFDRVEIRETSGGIENEFFGQFYTGFQPVPEPASLAMWGLAGAVGLVIARRRKRVMVA